MKTFETEHQHVFESGDSRGKYQFMIHKDLSQIQIESDIDDTPFSDFAFIDVNREELIAIRDLLTKAIGDNQ